MKITFDEQGEPQALSRNVHLYDAHGRPIALASVAGLDPAAHEDLRGEMGAGGVRYFSGYLYNEDEANQKLTGRDGIEIWNKMRRTDAKVDGVLQTINLPIESATWDIVMPPEDDPAYEYTTEEHVEFAKDQLFRRIDWAAYLKHALSCVWAGFAFFEKVYDLEDGKYVLKKVAPRLASSLWRWMVENNELVGVEQRVWRDQAVEFIKIPRDKIVLITFRQEANSYEGLSILRAVYKHFLIKDTLYKIDAIRLERFAIGTPVITLPEVYNETLFQLAKNIGKNWKGAEQSYVIKVQGMEVELLQMNGANSLDLIPTIKHHDEQIPMVALAQFMSFGTTETGARALGETTTEFFYDSEIALARLVCETTQRDLLWPTMDLNYPEKPRPRLVFRDLGAASLGTIIESLSKIGGFITPTRDTENSLRERLDMPALGEDEEFAPVRQQQAQQQAQQQMASGAPVSAVAAARQADGACPSCGGHHSPEQAVELQAKPSQQVVGEEEFWRPLRPSERFVALRQISGRMLDARDQMLRVLLAYRQEWATDLISQLVQHIPDGPKAITKAKLTPAQVKEAVEHLRPIAMETFEFGGQQVQAELQRQAREAGVQVKLTRNKVREKTVVKPWVDLMAKRGLLELRNEPLSEIDVNNLLTARLKILVNKMAQKTQDAAQQMAATTWRTLGADGLTPEEMGSIEEGLLASAEKEAKYISAASTSEALNLGRDAEAQRLIEDIDYTDFSAILDERVCTPCMDADGTEMEVGSEQYYEMMPPYTKCEGGNFCRCIYVFVLKP